MDDAQPIIDPTTLYRIELYGRVDEKWLQSFDSSMKIIAGESEETGNTTVLHIHTDQAGIVGLVRRLHGLGIAIQQIQIIMPKGE